MGDHRHIGLQRAIMKSCNSFFYRYGNATKIENIKKVTDMIGLGKGYGLPVNEQAGLVPDPVWLAQQENAGYKWTQATTAMVAIGQGGVACSPLQMAAAAAVAANGGLCFQPRLVERIEKADGSLIEEFPPKLLYDLREHGVTQEVIDRARNGMDDVVNALGARPGGPV